MFFLRKWKNRTRINSLSEKSRHPMWRIQKIENRRWLCHQHKSCPHCGAIFYRWSLDHEPHSKRPVRFFSWRSMEIGNYGIIILLFAPMLIALLVDYIIFLNYWIW